MSYEVHVRIDKVPKLVNAQRSHWAEKYRAHKEWITVIARAFIGKTPPEPLEKASVTIYRCSFKQPDTDNNYGAMKPVLDALIRNGILKGDSPKHIDLYVGWKPAPRAQAHLEIIIYEAELGPRAA